MNDSIQRFLFEHAPIRGEIARLDETWRAVLDRHDYPPALRSLLGEMMAAAALLAATIKFDGSMIMQMQGEGPVRLLVVECTSEYTMRATAKWTGEIGSAHLPDLLGAGRFAITLAARDGQQNYQGIVQLEGGTVAGILEHYMRHSEQLDTRIWLATDGTRAAGLLLQKLPQETRDADSWQRAQRLAETVTGAELLGLAGPSLLRRLYREEDVRVFEPRPVCFGCPCSRERVASMLRMLGDAEVREILAERGAVDVTCEFCNKAYRFDRAETERAFATESPGARTRH